MTGRVEHVFDGKTTQQEVSTPCSVFKQVDGVLVEQKVEVLPAFF